MVKSVKSKQDRLIIVLDLIAKLKTFTKINGNEVIHINLYNDEFPAIKELKRVFDQYIQQDDEHPHKLIGFSGKIRFPEISRTIQYRLPIGKHNAPLLILSV